MYQPIVSLVPARPSVLALHSKGGGRSTGNLSSVCHDGSDARQWLAMILGKAPGEQVNAALYIEMDLEELAREGLDALIEQARTNARTRGRLIVEIGGRSADSGDAPHDVLDDLRRAGIRVSMATEFSDASYQLLLGTHPDYLRVSDYIVRDCATDFHRRAVLEATTHLAWKFGSAVIADGVTKAEDLDLLRLLGIDYAEGGYLCAPLPFDEAIRWTENVSTKPTQERRRRSEEGS